MSRPLVIWGADEAWASWTLSGSVTRTTGQTDPLGGTAAVLLNSSDPSIAYATRVVTVDAFGQAAVYVCLRQGTATQSMLRMVDSTAFAARAQFQVAWSGGVPTVGPNQEGIASASSVIALGNGWYLIRLVVDGLVETNTNMLEIYPASFPSGNGSVYAYMRRMVLLPYPLDGAAQTPVARGGTVAVRSPAGVDDAWVTGTDWTVTGEVRHVPFVDADNPPSSGWYGRSTDVGIACGIAALFPLAADRADVLWVPEVSAIGTRYLVTLQADGPVALEEDGTRRFTLTLRSTKPIWTY